MGAFSGTSCQSDTALIKFPTRPPVMSSNFTVSESCCPPYGEGASTTGGVTSCGMGAEIKVWSAVSCREHHVP